MEKSVVTSFILNCGRILLLKRSDRVGSFRKHWHGVSGFLEGNEKPLKRAYMEILQETGITKGKLTLENSGKPVTIKKPGVILTIHPFLFSSATKKVRLNWENTDCRWVYPSRIKYYRTVPRLEKALKSAQNRVKLFSH